MKNIYRIGKKGSVTIVLNPFDRITLEAVSDQIQN